jgi:autotransporter-associated beta strand protein
MMNRTIPFRLTILSAALALACGYGPFVARVPAAVYSWSDVGASWTDPANWSGTAPGNSDTALFDLGGYVFQPNVTSPAGVGGIWDTGSAAVTISGSTLTLHAALINGNYATGLEMDPGSGSLTITAPLAVSGAQVWMNNAGPLNVQGNVANNGFTVSVAGSGNTTISGAIAGAGGLNMIGSGLLQLGGQNTYSGNTIVDGGTLQLPSGSLASLTQYVGYNFAGVVTQSGGANTGTTIYLAYSPGSSGSYSLSGGSVSSFDQVVGYAGGGNFIQSGGTNTFANTLQLGNGTAGTGNYSLTAGLLSGNEVDVGLLGRGSFAQSNGIASVNAIFVGTQASGNGTCSLSGGSLATTYEGVGYNGNGLFTQSGGTNTFVNFLEVGPGGSGTYSLTAGQLSGYEINLGVPGNGLINQSGGQASTTNALVVGFDTGARGTYLLSGSGVCSNPFILVGYGGSGSFTQSGGNNSVGDTLYLGYASGSSGSYGLSGGSLAAPAQEVGYSGNGSFTQSGGTIAFSSYLELGGGTSAAGTYKMTGGQAAGNEINVGVFGKGTFLHSGGLISLSNALVLGLGTASAGSYALSGSGYISVPTEFIGYSGSSTFTQTGGTNTASSDLVLAADTVSAATYNLNGGLLILGGGMESGSGSFAFNFSGGTLMAGNSWSTSVPITLPTSGSRGTINTNGFLVELNSPLSGPGGLALTDNSGGGALILATSNGHRGGTTVTSGSLQLGDPGSLGSGALAVNGGTLDLAGYSVKVASLSGAAGTITDSTGLLSILTTTQTTTTTFGGSLQDGFSPTALVLSGSGKLFLTGTNTYTGGTTIASGTLVVKQSYSLANGSNLTIGNSAAFAPVVPDATAVNDFPASSQIMPVPEPGTILLLAAGGTALCWRRRISAPRAKHERGNTTL